MIHLSVDDLKELLVRDVEIGDLATDAWAARLNLALGIIIEASDDPVNLHEFEAKATRLIKNNSLTTTMALKLFNFLCENGVPTHDDEVTDAVYRFAESMVDKADTM